MFGRMLEQLAAYVPILPAIGNHELEPMSSTWSHSHCCSLPWAQGRCHHLPFSLLADCHICMMLMLGLSDWPYLSCVA
jgi:hypothetical protein